MSSRIYTILGASGHVGGTIAGKLLEKGETVRVVSRHAENLKSLVTKGAQAFTGSTDDPIFLKKVFEGATAAFVMTPPDYKAVDHTIHQLRTGDTIAAALKGSTITHVVNLSSYHANDENAPRILHNLFLNEQKLDKLEHIQVLHLRPTSFMENQFSNLPLIPKGITGGMFLPDFKMPLIATKDIGAYAAKRLLDLDFSGNDSVVLLGQRDLSPNEFTQILSNTLGIPLHYVQFSAEDTKKAMMSGGHFGESAAGMMVEMSESFKSGKLAMVPRTAANTTPTSFEEFARIFKSVYEKQKNNS